MEKFNYCTEYVKKFSVLIKFFVNAKRMIDDDRIKDAHAFVEKLHDDLRVLSDFSDPSGVLLREEMIRTYDFREVSSFDSTGHTLALRDDGHWIIVERAMLESSDFFTLLPYFEDGGRLDVTSSILSKIIDATRDRYLKKDIHLSEGRIIISLESSLLHGTPPPLSSLSPSQGELLTLAYDLDGNHMHSSALISDFVDGVAVCANYEDVYGSTKLSYMFIDKDGAVLSKVPEKNSTSGKIRDDRAYISWRGVKINDTGNVYGPSGFLVKTLEEYWWYSKGQYLITTADGPCFIDSRGVRKGCLPVGSVVADYSEKADGIALIRIPGGYVFYNEDAQRISGGPYDKAFNYCGDAALVSNNETWFFIDRSGKMISEKILADFVDWYSEGVACAKETVYSTKSIIFSHVGIHFVVAEDVFPIIDGVMKLKDINTGVSRTVDRFGHDVNFAPNALPEEFTVKSLTKRK